MSGQRQRNEIALLTDRRTNKLVHIHSVTSCCLRCNIRQRRDWYYIFNEEFKLQHPERHFRERQPSWKLVSKRKKQWMRRPLKIEEHERWRTIEW